MKIHLPLLFAAALLMAVAPVHAETAAEIVQRFETQKAAALEAYLKASPSAPDAEEATYALLHAYEELGDDERAGVLLKQRLAGLATGAALEPQVYFSTLQSLVEILSRKGDKEGARALVTAAQGAVKGHAMEERMIEFLGQLAGTLNKPGVGDTLEIAFTSLQGEQIDLAKHKGEVVLVDFWATWCGPCVAELPTVKKAYEEFHSQGFHIIAISLDEDKAALEGFIKTNNMPWPQEFSGKGWESPMAQKFGIEGIPATFLVGRDGKVVATDLHGPALAAAVKEALAAPAP